MTWGVTDVDDERLTLRSFGDFKSPVRLEAECKLAAYLNNFSEPRYDGGFDTFAIAAAIGAPGSGKSRLLDDTVRGQIAAELRDGVPVNLFDPSDKLMLAITFNGRTTSRRCAFELASRCVLEFFCGVPKRLANRVLEKIDVELAHHFRGYTVAEVELAVLDALEELFFRARARPPGRSVLLVDEISIARSEKDVYDLVVQWIDEAPVDEEIGAASRRGAVFTGVTILSPWTRTDSQRKVTSLALGLFDVWAPNVQAAIWNQVQAQPQWRNVATPPDSFWSLLASTGGRPRDIESMLASMTNVCELDSINDLCAVAIEKDEDIVFKWFLLPSLLGVTFSVRGGTDATIFGRCVASRALLNADLLAAGGGQRFGVPSVSLRWSMFLPGTLQTVFMRLVTEMTFFGLRHNSEGNDFERTWLLLLHTHLLLQHRVRQGGDRLQFWPPGRDVADVGGPVIPTGASLDIFANGVRESALFAPLTPSRVYEAPGSTIRRSVSLYPAVEPTVMQWLDLWAVDVRVADEFDAMTNVAWRSPSLVYFSLRTHEAIDFMLLVNGSDGSPHVYMFQCKACMTTITAGVLQQIVDQLDGKLDMLFSAAFARHVLRRAGVKSKKQVTLCIAALMIGDFNLAPSAEAPSDLARLPLFNVVLFDADAIRCLGGSAFETTRFMRCYIKGKLETKQKMK
jgi:hypothetical protein